MTDNIYNPDFVKGLFNRMSSSYEGMNYITSFGFSIRWRKQFLNPLTASNEEIKVIDLLTGMGEAWDAISDKFPNAHLSALDFSPEMLKKARAKNERKFNNKVTLLQQDILQNKIPDDSYDIVICAFGLKTFDNDQMKRLAIETKRILKSGGQFSFIEVSKPDHKILRWLYGFYLGKLIPLFGLFFLADPSQYKMLWRYTSKFENALNAKLIFNSVGLNTTSTSYFSGCATGIAGFK